MGSTPPGGFHGLLPRTILDTVLDGPLVWCLESALFKRYDDDEVENSSRH